MREYTYLATVLTAVTIVGFTYAFGLLKEEYVAHFVSVVLIAVVCAKPFLKSSLKFLGIAFALVAAVLAAAMYVEHGSTIWFSLFYVPAAGIIAASIADLILRMAKIGERESSPH